MRIRIGTKIFIALFIFFIEILTVMFTFSIINRHHEHVMHNQHQGVERLDLVRSLQIALSQVVMPANDFLILGGAENEFENFKVLSAKAEALIEKLNNLTFESDEERELLDHIKGEYLQVKDIATKIFSIPNAVGNIEAGRLMEEMDEIVDDALRDAEDFRHFAHQAMEKANIGMEKVKSTFDTAILVGILFNVIFVSIVLFFFRRDLVLPIKSIRDVVLEVGRGNLENKISIKNNDEIGDLAISFNRMTEDLKRLIQKERELTLLATTARDAEKKKALELEKSYKQLKETQDILIQAEKMNAVGQLASGVAHEVKNPLGVIIQGINYLETKFASLEQTDITEVFNMINDSVKRADEIMRTLLDFSRATELEMRPEDINSILETSLVLVQHRIKKGNIEIIKQLKRDLPNVMVDRRKIEQVFINIFLNATQAIPERGRIIIRTYDTQLEEIKNGIGRREEDYFRLGEKAVIVEVEDTGIGIPQENLRKIFEPFFTTKGPREGTGLGLSVTRNIIDLHRGLINVESQVGKGTKIIIVLRIASDNNKIEGPISELSS